MRHNSNCYQEIVELQKEMIFRFLPSGAITFVNQACCDYFRMNREALVNRNMYSLVLSSDRQLFQQQIKDVNPGRPWAGVENRVALADGSIRWVYWSMVALFDEQGDVKGYQAVGQDITERKWIEERLRASEYMQQAILEAIPDALFRINSQGAILYYKGDEKLLYRPVEHFVGKHVSEALPLAVARQLLQKIQTVLEIGEMTKFECSLDFKGAEAFLEARIVMLTEEEVLVIVRNFTERYQMEEQLNYLSWHDSLTKLYNRNFFEKEMNRVDGAARWSGGIIVCDVDGLKIVNDSLGHKGGDELLIAAANALKKSVRDADIVARIGGDEFAIILSNADDAVLAKACSRIKAAAEAYNGEDPANVPLKISCGFSGKHEDPISVFELFRQADAAMYQDKESNRLDSIAFVVEKTLRIREKQAEYPATAMDGEPGNKTM